MAEELIGKVSDFFAQSVVAGIDLSGNLKTGDRIRIVGHTTDLSFTVESIQVDNQNVTEGKLGDAVGIKLPDRAHRGDSVYRVS